MESARPDDFALSYARSTGSLPPQYHHASTVEIGADGEGVLETQLSYSSGPSERFPFALDSAAMDALYTSLQEAGAFSTAWREEVRPPVGGGSWRLTITASGAETELPRFVVREQYAEKDRVGEVVWEAVPAEVREREAAWRSETQRF